MRRQKIKSSSELAKLDFSKIDEVEFKKAIGPARLDKLTDYFSTADILVSKAEIKRAKKKEKLKELKSRMK